MAIRFTPEYNKEIRRVVRNFNRKRNDAVRKGIKNVPEALSVTELKSRYSNRRQLNRELTSLKRFSDDNALRVIETSGGAKAIKWEYDYLKKNIRYAKAFFDRQIAEALSIDTTLRVTQAEYVNNLKAKRDYLDLELSELTPAQFRTVRKTINDYMYDYERKSSSYRSWMNEVEIIMRNLGYDNKTIDKFFEGFDNLTPQQFLRMYQQSALISRIYELYIPTRDHSFKLSTTEEDAKEMINSFMIQKDAMIKKAKAVDKLKELEENQEVKKFAEELRRTSVPKPKSTPGKIPRKDLTPEDIEKLKALGWEDLIE